VEHEIDGDKKKNITSAWTTTSTKADGRGRRPGESVEFSYFLNGWVGFSGVLAQWIRARSNGHVINNRVLRRVDTCTDASEPG
jgi:hypothetical protein